MLSDNFGKTYGNKNWTANIATIQPAMPSNSLTIPSIKAMTPDTAMNEITMMSSILIDGIFEKEPSF